MTKNPHECKSCGNLTDAEFCPFCVHKRNDKLVINRRAFPGMGDEDILRLFRERNHTLIVQAADDEEPFRGVPGVPPPVLIP